MDDDPRAGERAEDAGPLHVHDRAVRVARAGARPAERERRNERL